MIYKSVLLKRLISKQCGTVIWRLAKRFYPFSKDIWNATDKSTQWVGIIIVLKKMTKRYCLAKGI